MSEQRSPYNARKKNLLIDEYPLLVLPSLAVSIGLNEAIALQQLHYWLENPKGGVEIDGYRWVYNTYEDWQRDNFPFWSVRTVQRVFLNLEKIKLVISRQSPTYDRKKYYRIHYDKLALWNETTCLNPDLQDGTKEDDKEAQSLNESETTTETTTENIDIDAEKQKELIIDAIKPCALQLWPKTPRNWYDLEAKIRAAQTTIENGVLVISGLGMEAALLESRLARTFNNFLVVNTLGGFTSLTFQE